MERLILIRHGETEKNVSGKLHDYDDPEILNETGHQQIVATSGKLREFSPAVIYSSTEKRATQSAEIISQMLGIPLKLVDGMQERNWGTFSGRAWPEIQAVLEPMPLEERYTYVPPQGESWKQVEERLIQTIDKILEDNEEKTVVVVTHGGAIRILMPHFLGTPKEETFKHNPDNASITLFDHSGGRFTQVLINDTKHLRQRI